MTMTFVRRSLVMIGTPVAVFFILTIIVARAVVSGFSVRQTEAFMQEHTEKSVLKLENELVAPMKMTEAISWVFRDGFHDSDEATNEVFINMSQAYPDFSGFYGCRTDKTIFKTPGLTLPDGYDPTSRGWYKGAVVRAGKNFHIVATEIRRLADGIIDGTKEIKESISEIQQSSDTLILASENGTEKIRDGVENARQLMQRFSRIKNASEITAESAGDITTIIQQQAAASEQMLMTLRQIASGVESFSDATGKISIASQNLQGIAEELAK